LPPRQIAQGVCLRTFLGAESGRRVGVLGFVVGANGATGEEKEEGRRKKEEIQKSLPVRLAAVFDFS